MPGGSTLQFNPNSALAPLTAENLVLHRPLAEQPKSS
jgi:hypothetical protein